MNFPKILWQDILVTLSLVANLLAQWTTIFLTSTLKNVVEKTEFLEANPLQRLIQNFQFINFIWLAFTWAVVLGLYLYMRRRRGVDESWKVSFDTTAFALFLILFIDVWRNSAVILGILLGG